MALGEIQSYIENGEIGIVLTLTLQLFVNDFDWTKVAEYPLLRDIYMLLNQWFLQTHEALIVIDVASLETSGQHPIPADCDDRGNIALWAEELNKLLLVHNSCTSASGECFIGVACHIGFSGGETGRYQTEALNCFPLVGPSELTLLADAFEWEVKEQDIQQPVRFDDAKRHVFALGATELTPPRRGSHYKARFRNARPWILDYNEDPIKDSFVKELVDIVNYPFDVCKFVLINGVFPEKKCKFCKSTLIPRTAVTLGRS